MKLVDVNVLVYVADIGGPEHAVVRPWWDSVLASGESVAVTWPILSSYLRIVTNPKIVASPTPVAEAVTHIEGWLSHASVSLVSEPPGFQDDFTRLVRETPATGNLIPDAHLAAIAIGHDATLVSCDTDFAKFAGLRWENPLAA